jgi:hypothetical protein
MPTCSGQVRDVAVSSIIQKFTELGVLCRDIPDNRSLGPRDRNDITFQNMKRYNKSVSFVEKERT